jgi:hypothetical protein
MYRNEGYTQILYSDAADIRPDTGFDVPDIQPDTLLKKPDIRLIGRFIYNNS